MLGYIAVALFGIAFIINAASVSTDAIFAPFSLMLLGWINWLIIPLAIIGSCSAWRASLCTSPASAPACRWAAAHAVADNLLAPASQDPLPHRP